jgi:lambda family phage portal protein|tara:strand:+ start:438 stop:2231 length:1794 start_codon:yes stop_codon:yes gene_type:complete
MFSFIPGHAARKRREESAQRRHELQRQRFRRDMAAIRAQHDTIQLATGFRNDHMKRIVNWTPGDFQAVLSMDREELQDKSTELYWTNGTAQGIAQGILNSVIGNMLPQSMIDPKRLGLDDDIATAIQDTVEAEFRTWAAAGSVIRQETFKDCQELSFLSLFNRGEYFYERVRRAPNDLQPYNTRCRLIHTSRIKTPHDKRRDGNVQDGIEINADGSEIAYWVKQTLDKEGKVNHNLPDKAENFQRIPAYDRFGRVRMGHRYARREIGRYRGLPELTPVLDRFKMLAKWDEAWITREWFSACIGLILETPAGGQGLSALGKNKDGGRDTDTATGQEKDYLWPGMVFRTRPGEKPHQFHIANTSEHYEVFKDRQVDDITAAIAVPSPVLDPSRLGDATFSSARVMTLKAIKQFLFYHALIAHLGQDFYRHVLEEIILRGPTSTRIPQLPITADQYFLQKAEWLRTSWGTVPYGLIDPNDEADAYLKLIEGNLSTLEHSANQLGQTDWRGILRQRKREEDFRKELGLADPFDTTPGHAGTPAGPNLRIVPLPETATEDERRAMAFQLILDTIAHYTAESHRTGQGLDALIRPTNGNGDTQ